MCKLHHLHKKFTQFLFQNQPENYIKKDLFPDPNYFVPPSPLLNFRELPEPPTITEGKRNTEAKISSKNIALGKESNKEAETIENDSTTKLKESTKPSKYDRKEKTQLLKSEYAGKQEKEDDDICPKCHHKKGMRKRKNVKKNELTNVDDSDLSKSRQTEEKEILHRYTKETPSADHFCNCSIHGVDNKSLKQRKVNNNETNLIKT